MTRVLRQLGAIDQDNVVQLKGRVAAELNTTVDEMLVTELLFSNTFNDLSVAQTAAMLSCLAYKGPPDADAAKATLPREIQEPFDRLKQVAARVAQIMLDAGDLECGSVQSYVEEFSPKMMEVAFEWVNGQKFATICKIDKKLYEGSIIRCMRRLEEFVRQMCGAAKVIGDNSLYAKFDECSRRTKRGIIFAASLYL